MENKETNQRNEQGKLHGYSELFWPNGNLKEKGHYKGNYINGKRYGCWESYYSHGDLCFKGHYINGKRHGYCEGYHYLNGILGYKEYHAK